MKKGLFKKNEGVFGLETLFPRTNKQKLNGY